MRNDARVLEKYYCSLEALDNDSTFHSSVSLS